MRSFALTKTLDCSRPKEKFATRGTSMSVQQLRLSLSRSARLLADFIAITLAVALRCVFYCRPPILAAQVAHEASF